MYNNNIIKKKKIKINLNYSFIMTYNNGKRIIELF